MESHWHVAIGSAVAQCATQHEPSLKLLRPHLSQLRLRFLGSLVANKNHKKLNSTACASAKDKRLIDDATASVTKSLDHLYLPRKLLSGSLFNHLYLKHRHTELQFGCDWLTKHLRCCGVHCGYELVTRRPFFLHLQLYRLQPPHTARNVSIETKGFFGSKASACAPLSMQCDFSLLKQLVSAATP